MRPRAPSAALLTTLLIIEPVRRGVKAALDGDLAAEGNMAR
jgi:hypothetical protein